MLLFLLLVSVRNHNINIRQTFGQCCLVTILSWWAYAQGLSGCLQLRTLLAANNRLAGPDALADLAECKALITLDLQENQLSDSQVQSCVLRGK